MGTEQPKELKWLVQTLLPCSIRQDLEQGDPRVGEFAILLASINPHNADDLASMAQKFLTNPMQNAPFWPNGFAMRQWARVATREAVIPRVWLRWHLVACWCLI